MKERMERAQKKKKQKKKKKTCTRTLQRHHICLRALVAPNPVLHTVVEMLTLCICLTVGGSEGDGADLEDDGEELQGFVFSKLK